MSTFDTISRCFEVLDSKDRKKAILVGCVSLALSTLDIFAIALIGVIGALAVTGIQSRPPSPNIERLFDFFPLEGVSFQGQVAFFGLIAGLTLLLKTFLSSYVNYRISIFLAHRSAELSARLIASFIRSGIEKVNKYTTQQTVFALTQGTNVIILGVIGSFIFLVAEASLLFMITSALFIVNPTLAAGTLIYFALVALLMNRLVQRRIENLAVSESLISVNSNELISESRGFYKELVAKGREDFYVNALSKSRYELARVQARLSFIPTLPKYVTEIALVVGGVLISAATLLMYDAESSVSSLAIFILSAFRISPAVLRMQTGLSSIKQNLASSFLTFEMISTNHKDFYGEIQIKDLEFKYTEDGKFFLKVENLEVTAGKILGISGESGSGKSTLLNLILGVLEKKSGILSISGRSPKSAIAIWPGAISYVPQEIFLSTASVRENVSLGYHVEDIPSQIIEEVLRVVELSNFIHSLPNGLETKLEERGSNLSGGQRQRLGIARALITRPKILILDEATSALDKTTKNSILRNIRNFSPDTTIIIVSHDEEVLAQCDSVAYSNQGTFKDLP
jgi:ABC-type bacteriocin/lantibiotic exporter with double-glycine peptidase domain